MAFPVERSQFLGDQENVESLICNKHEEADSGERPLRVRAVLSLRIFSVISDT